MSLSNGDLSAADVAAVVGNNGGNGNSWGWGDGSFWIIILFLFAFMGNGWGGNWGGNAATAAYVTQADMQRGFDQTATMSALSGLNATVANGFASAEIASCDRLANLTAQMNNIAMQQQNCCCENRAAVADLKYVIAQENAADRVSINNGVRDILENQNNGIQKILDTMCQDRIDAKNERIQELQNQLTMANLAASQNAQTASIIANNDAQTANLLQRLNPTPIPAYTVPSPYASYGFNYGCGCGTVA